MPNPMSQIGGTQRSPINIGPSDAARFHKRVAAGDPDACWLWPGRRDRYGYGKARIGERRDVLAHRVAAQLAGLCIEGFLVCHHCDEPLCCNPAHLFVGTDAENVADMVAKGRRVQPDNSGEMNGRARLSADDVRWIRWTREYSSTTHHSIAVAFGVSKSAITGVLSGRYWAE